MTTSSTRYISRQIIIVDNLLKHRFSTLLRKSWSILIIIAEISVQLCVNKTEQTDPSYFSSVSMYEIN